MSRFLSSCHVDVRTFIRSSRAGDPCLGAQAWFVTSEPRRKRLRSSEGVALASTFGL